MLKVSNLYPQLQDLSSRLAQRAPQFSKNLRRFYELLQSQSALKARFNPEQAAHKVMAIPIEEPALKKATPPRPKELTLCASDGSQIFPDRHLSADFFLLNLSRIVLHLGVNEKPMLRNEAQLFEREMLAEKLNVSEEDEPILTVELVTAMRQEAELQVLLETCQSLRVHRPLLALADGTLLCWHLKRLQPLALQRHFIERYASTLTQFQAGQLTVASYISAPSSREVSNLLQQLLCSELEKEDLSLELWLNDARLFFGYLQRGERSAVFASRSEILQHYEPSDRVYFFYLHTGYEIARVEFPKWCYDAGATDFIHAVVMDDVQKGRGYPMILTEAHEQAAITPAEQEEFYRLLEHLCALQGQTLNYSAKSLSKRIAKL